MIQTIRVRLQPVVALMCLSAVALLAGCGKEEVPVAAGPRPVKMMEVAQDTIQITREFPGQAAAVQSTDLSFRVSGNLIELPIEEGQQVKEGELLARIDPRDYATRVEDYEGALAQATAQLSAMRSGARPEDLARLEADVRGREAEFQEVNVREQRNARLLADGVVSQQEYDQVKAEYNVALTNLEAAQQQLEIGKKGAREEDILAQEAVVESMQAQLKEAQDALDDTYLKAPFTGEIARKYVNNFEEVQAKEPVLILQDVTQIEVDIDLSERDMALGTQGGSSLAEIVKRVEAVVSFSALPGKEYPARVKSFEKVADSLTQTFRVTMVLDNPEGNPVLPGMNATVRTTGRSGTGLQGFFIPVGAIFSDPSGAKCAWIVKDGEARRRVIEGEEVIDGDLRVTKGLEDGETIAVSAIHTLVEGQRVRRMTDLKKL